MNADEERRELRLRELAQKMSDRMDALKAERAAENLLQFPRRKKRGAKVRKGPAAEIVPIGVKRNDIAYRYGLLRAVGTDGELREGLIQEGIAWVERRNESGIAPWTEDDLREMVESKRERLLWQLEDLEKML